MNTRSISSTALIRGLLVQYTYVLTRSYLGASARLALLTQHHNPTLPLLLLLYHFELSNAHHFQKNI